MNIIELMFEDITKVPMIASSTQELWLGIQIKAPQTWAGLDYHDDQVLLGAIYASLNLRLSDFEKKYSETNLLLPNFETWATEAYEARKDIFALRPSQLRRFIHTIDKLTDEIKNEFLNTTYDSVELLCLLPDSALEHIAQVGQTTGKWPTWNEFQTWIQQHPCKHTWELVEERASRAQSHLVTGYLRYALRIARSNIGKGVEYVDLVQEGILGLMHAAKHFDYREGARFATFASSWISQRIGRVLADQGRTIRLPVHMHDRIQFLKKELEARSIENWANFVATEYLSALDEEDFEGETVVDRKSSSSVHVWRKAYRLLEYCQPLIPLDLKLPGALLEHVGFKDTEDTALVDYIEDIDFDMGDQQSEWQRIIQMLFETTSGISARDCEIVRLRYGLDDGVDRTLEEVGQRYHLTRERIRQIENRVLEKFKQNLHTHRLSVEFSGRIQRPELLSLPVYAYLNDCFITAPDIEDEEMTKWQQIDYSLAQLPGGDWHTYRMSKGGTRQEQIIAALRILETPAHYSAIAEQVNVPTNRAPMDEGHVYTVLMKYEDVFLRLGEGYFSLPEWERQRATEIDPIIPFCPAPLPDPLSQPNAFFESVAMVRVGLQAPCSATTFLRTQIKWSGLSWPQSPSVCHSAFVIYYLVGVIPYIFYPDDPEKLLSFTLPDGDLPTLRLYCLDTLTCRLQAMPEFWWLLQHYQPIRVTELARLFVEAHPLGLDDVANRLSLLTGIGAAHKSPYGGRYQLTRLGEMLAARWARQPESISGPVVSPTEDEGDFVEFLFE